MKIIKLEISNFRTIEELSIEFPSFYTAISGRNNAGKSNVLRVLKSLFNPEPRYSFHSDEITVSGHFPKWKNKNDKDLIKFLVTLELNRERDAAVFKLVGEFFKINNAISDIQLQINSEYTRDKDQPEIGITYNAEKLDSYKSRTVLKTIRSSGAFQFYNSTEPDDPFVSRTQFTNLFGELSKSDREVLERDRDKLSKTVSSFAKKHQKDISSLLGRLEDKYLVGLSAPKLDLDFLPINITLGSKNLDVSLDDWGSGTKNRTHILLTLFKAKKLTESNDEDTKISPVLVIEEPESFLHPSAQAEFGRLLQELCEEFNVQVIVATHSPYFLSQQQPESNILLCREINSGQLRKTELIKVESDNWMEPFATNLGLANPEFAPWKDIFFSKTNSIVLVEGDIDKEYLSLLRDPSHGSNKLDFDGEIFPYNGIGSLTNGVLLRFIRDKYHKFFITFDLDAEPQLQKVLQTLGVEKLKHYYPIGINGGGKNKIEGLLPDSIRNKVYGENGDLVQQGLSGDKDEASRAKQKLKRLLLDEFRDKAMPGMESYKEFYKLAKIINKAMI